MIICHLSQYYFILRPLISSSFPVKHKFIISPNWHCFYFPVLTLLNDLGGYVPTDELDPPDLSSLLGKLFRLNGDPLFDVYVDRELQNHSRLALFVDLPRRLKYNIGHRLRLNHQKVGLLVFIGFNGKN